ncbi:MAG TPA: hypothetical protein GXX55_07440 [Firmicutes bacterium]|nr:hypothetical protein [Bacillota bacterium]
MTPDLTRFTGNEPGPVASLQALQDLAWKHKVMPADAANMTQEFASGQGALYGDGTWGIQILLQSKETWDFAPFFQVPGYRAAGAIPGLVANLPAWAELMRQAAGNRQLNFGLLLEEVQNFGMVLQVRKLPAWDAIDRAMRPVVWSVFQNQLPAQQAMDQVAPQINKLLAEAMAGKKQ